VSSPGEPGTVTSTGPAAVPAPCPRDRHDPWLGTGSNDASTLPPAGQPGHGSTAFLRSQPVRIVHGRVEGGYTDVFELICPDCGDHRDLDYSEISWRLQRLRGPHMLEAGLAAYHIHLGLAWQTRTEPEAAGPGCMEAGQAAVAR
jgi:hypothetical protein